MSECYILLLGGSNAKHGINSYEVDVILKGLYLCNFDLQETSNIIVVRY